MRRDVQRLFQESQVLAAQAGDRTAFGHLAACWQPRLLAHARRLTDTSDMARDVLQDAWVDIVRGLPRLRDPVAFPAWSYRIVTRKAAQAVSRIQRTRRTADDLARDPGQARVEWPEAEARSDLARVSHAIAALPPAQRAAMGLHYMDGFSVAEIAVALGIPAGTVKTRLMHARRKIRAALESDREGDSDDTQ